MDPEIAASMVTATFAALGRTVTYAGADITAIIHYQAPDDGGKSRVLKATAKVQVTDVATPAYRDEIVDGSFTWTVKDWSPRNTGLVWLLELESGERPRV